VAPAKFAASIGLLTVICLDADNANQISMERRVEPAHFKLAVALHKSSAAEPDPGRRHAQHLLRKLFSRLKVFMFARRIVEILKCSP
jgi:hypothetical protein